MTSPNDVVAVIVIVLFILLAAIAFGIWRVMQVIKNSYVVTESTSSRSTATPEIEIVN